YTGSAPSYATRIWASRSTSIQRSPGSSIGGGGAGVNVRRSPAAIHSPAATRYALGLPALSFAVSRIGSGVFAATWRFTPPPSAVLVVHASWAPNRGHTKPTAVTPVS